MLRLIPFMAIPLTLVLATAALGQGKPPDVGDEAPDFALKNLDGKEVRLSELRKAGPVVLVVLRGFPGYQCPICNVQVGEILAQAKRFEEAKAQIVFVYPGPAEKLGERAREFVGTRSLPAGVQFLIDPDYTFTSAYALRWDKPRETAYPSTFVIDAKGVVRYALVSMTHGGRAKAATVLEALGKL